MKHIFSIHSPLTFLVAYAVIEHLKLDKKEVIIFTNAYKVPIDDYQVYQIPVNETSRLNKLINLNFPVFYDRFIKKVTDDEPFIAYVAWMSYYNKVMITNSLCKKFHFIEEGLTSYQTYHEMSDVSWSIGNVPFRFKSYFSSLFLRNFITLIRGFNQRLNSIPAHYLAYSGFKDFKYFSISKNAFYLAPEDKKIILKPKMDSSIISKMSKGMKLNDEVIWIEGSFGKDYGYSANQYQNATLKALEKLENLALLKQKIYVKLRPTDYEADNNYLVKLLKKKGYKVELISNDIVIESLFMVSKSCTVIGALSSALEFAHIYGHQSYSFFSLFENHHKSFYDRIDGYWNNVKQL